MATPRPKRRLRASGGTIMMLVAVLLGVLVLAPTVQQFIGQRQRVAELQAEIARSEEAIAMLQTQKARWDDPAYIQAQARGRLLFVRPGETTYLVIGDQAHVASGSPTESRPEQYATQEDWMANFAQSFVVAGTSQGPLPSDQGATP